MIGRLVNRAVGLACLPALPLLALAALWITRGSPHKAERSYCWHLRMLYRSAIAYVRDGGIR